jgi:hypothetical protein
MGPKFTKPSPNQTNRSHDQDEHQCYGLSVYGSIPIDFIQQSLDSNLLEFLQADPFFQTPELNLEQVGYAKAVDYPEIKKHYYYEGYYHGLPTTDHFRSVHSRYGYDFDKPRAALRLTSFLEAVRRVNTSWTEQIISALRDELSPDNAAALGIIRMLEENRHFADISSQIHFGDEIPHHQANFHNDGPNSTIHLALSVNGKRSLFWKGSKDPAFVEDIYSTDEPRGYVTHEEKQIAGSVYVSSPSIVSHAVGYPKCIWSDRVIAVQCRCLFTNDEYDAMHTASIEEWKEVMTVVSSCLAIRKASVADPGASRCEYVFRLPNLTEVQNIYDELLLQWINKGEVNKS